MTLRELLSSSISTPTGVPALTAHTIQSPLWLRLKSNGRGARTRRGLPCSPVAKRHERGATGACRESAARQNALELMPVSRWQNQRCSVFASSLKRARPSARADSKALDGFADKPVTHLPEQVIRIDYDDEYTAQFVFRALDGANRVPGTVGTQHQGAEIAD